MERTVNVAHYMCPNDVKSLVINSSILPKKLFQKYKESIGNQMLESTSALLYKSLESFKNQEEPIRDIDILYPIDHSLNQGDQQIPFILFRNINEAG